MRPNQMTIQLCYSFIDEAQKNLAAPAPSLNGGLYAGEPFAGAWRNYPSMPDASYAVQRNLQSAGPPPGAAAQPPGTLRPGNSGFEYPTPALRDLSAHHRLQCVAAADRAPSEPTPRPPAFFATSSLPEKPWRTCPTYPEV
jgi:hypothetical protein